MIVTIKSWKKLFLLCLGLSFSAAFCMKWMENDLWVQNGKFTILGLELFYSKEKVSAVLAGLDAHVRTILRYHLSFDFAFMAGVYPGIASLCMMAKEKTRAVALKRILHILAALQLTAWAADIAENYYLFHWINDPRIGNDFGLYHVVVSYKWIIALCGVLFSLPFVLRRKRIV